MIMGHSMIMIIISGVIDLERKGRRQVGIKHTSPLPDVRDSTQVTAPPLSLQSYQESHRVFGGEVFPMMASLFEPECDISRGKGHA